MNVILFTLGLIASLPVLAVVFIITVWAVRIPFEIAAMGVSFPLSLLDAIINITNGYEGSHASRVGRDVHEGLVGCCTLGTSFLITLNTGFRIWTWLWLLVS